MKPLLRIKEKGVPLFPGTEELAVEQVVDRPILFIVAVMDYAIKEGR
jgi:hypothetical protein